MALEQRPKYPIVRCDDHPGQDEPGYAICVHVVAGKDVAHFRAATPEKLGEVLCSDCIDDKGPGFREDLKHLTLGCAHLVREQGWDKVESN